MPYERIVSNSNLGNYQFHPTENKLDIARWSSSRMLSEFQKMRNISLSEGSRVLLAIDGEVKKGNKVAEDVLKTIRSKSKYSKIARQCSEYIVGEIAKRELPRPGPRVAHEEIELIKLPAWIVGLGVKKNKNNMSNVGKILESIRTDINQRKTKVSHEKISANLLNDGGVVHLNSSLLDYNKKRIQKLEKEICEVLSKAQGTDITMEEVLSLPSDKLTDVAGKLKEYKTCQESARKLGEDISTALEKYAVEKGPVQKERHSLQELEKTVVKIEEVVFGKAGTLNAPRSQTGRNSTNVAPFENNPVNFVQNNTDVHGLRKTSFARGPLQKSGIKSWFGRLFSGRGGSRLNTVSIGTSLKNGLRSIVSEKIWSVFGGSASKTGINPQGEFLIMKTRKSILEESVNENRLSSHTDNSTKEYSYDSDGSVVLDSWQPEPSRSWDGKDEPDKQLSDSSETPIKFAHDEDLNLDFVSFPDKKNT